MTPRPSAARRLLLAMPKAELHLHLDGCLRPVTAIELALQRGIAAPQTFMEMFDALVAPTGTSSQADLLRYFDLPIALMQDVEALTRITTELVEDKAADRVAYMEIKWAPALHLERGLSLDELVTRGITLDLCPTSNVQAGTVSSIAAHPLALLLRRGVKVTINTDDTTISNVTPSEEMHSCHVELGLTLSEIWRCNLNAVEAAFVDADTRAALHASFRRWGEHIPELHAPELSPAS